MSIAGDPGLRLREIGDRVGISERAAHRVVAELVDTGYVTRKRIGSRNQYTIQSDRPLPGAGAGALNLGEALSLLAPRR